jgi:hypothetical protein
LVAVVQFTFKHKQYTECRGRSTHNNLKKLGSKLGSAGHAPSLRFALQLRKMQGKTSVRVVVKCPDNLVAVVQYSFTHTQYTEQHNDTERNIHNNKNN